EDIWPAYLTVNYKVMSEDGKKEITSGTFMPMNADDGPHYGINVCEGYGMTETAPMISFNPLLEAKPGTAGKVLRNLELLIAEDG
ncbi:iron transporter, partial [Fusobacterium necrophorum]|uniref:iron transporter n=1 Tax=Fusobacterium necrophorum TaxID=859 RepID=UPI0021C49D33